MFPSSRLIAHSRNLYRVWFFPLFSCSDVDLTLLQSKKSLTIWQNIAVPTTLGSLHSNRHVETVLFKLEQPAICEEQTLDHSNTYQLYVWIADADHCSTSIDCMTLTRSYKDSFLQSLSSEEHQQRSKTIRRDRKCTIIHTCNHFQLYRGFKNFNNSPK